MCLCDSFVLNFYQKHTRHINQMSQWFVCRRGAGEDWEAEDHDDSMTNGCMWACVCGLQTYFIAVAVKLPPISLPLASSSHFAHTTAVRMPWVLVRVINLVIYWWLSTIISFIYSPTLGFSRSVNSVNTIFCTRNLVVGRAMYRYCCTTHRSKATWFRTCRWESR